MNTELRGKCREAVMLYCQMNPGMRLVRGYYMSILWGPQPHWWCVSESGMIHDPTVDQFPDRGANTKKPMVGKCANHAVSEFTKNNSRNGVMEVISFVRTNVMGSWC